MDLNKKLMTFPTKDTNFNSEFFVNHASKNMKQIITSRELLVLLKDAFIKFGEHENDKTESSSS